jgi:molybdopterin-binding protein
MRISARNQLAGTVVSVAAGVVTTAVKVQLGGGDIITASITKEVADELGLVTGSPVIVVVKASDVILGVE